MVLPSTIDINSAIASASASASVLLVRVSRLIIAIAPYCTINN